MPSNTELKAGALNQIAQGNSLRRVFGTDAAGFESNYKAMANTQADMQNITARETTRSAREHFGAGLQGGGSNGISYAHAAHSNADLKHDQFAGTAQGYDDAMAEAKAKGIEGSPFQHSAHAQVGAQGIHQANIDKQEQESAKQNVGNQASAKAQQQFDGLNADGHQQRLEKLNSDWRKDSLANLQSHDYDIAMGDDSSVRNINEAYMAKKTELQNAYNADKKAWGNAASQQAIQQAQSSGAIERAGLDKQMHTLADGQTLNYSQTSANVSAAHSTSMMSGGMVTNAGMNAMTISAMQQQHSMLAMNDRFGSSNAASLNQSLQDMGMNAAQMSSIMSAGSPIERTNRFMAATRSSTLQGTFQGRSFMLKAGVDGQYQGNFDSRISFTGGYTADMGDMYDAMAYGAKGVDGLKGWATTKTVYRGINDAIDVGLSVTPTGRIGKVGKMAKGFGGRGGAGSLNPTQMSGVNRGNNAWSGHTSPNETIPDKFGNPMLLDF